MGKESRRRWWAPHDPELVAGVGKRGGEAVGRAGVHPAGRREVDEHPRRARRPRHQLLHQTHRVGRKLERRRRGPRQKAKGNGTSTLHCCTDPSVEQLEALVTSTNTGFSQAQGRNILCSPVGRTIDLQDFHTLLKVPNWPAGTVCPAHLPCHVPGPLHGHHFRVTPEHQLQACGQRQATQQTKSRIVDRHTSKARASGTCSMSSCCQMIVLYGQGIQAPGDWKRF